MGINNLLGHIEKIARHKMKAHSVDGDLVPYSKRKLPSHLQVKPIGYKFILNEIHSDH